MTRRAFTLIEVLATVLLVAIGMGAIIALMQANVRRSGAAQSQAMQQITLQALYHCAMPLGATPMSANDGRGWEVASTSGSTSSPIYSVSHRGYINGFFAIRTESSIAEDILTPNLRWVEVDVQLFRGADGSYVTSGRRRMLRRY